jgi:squalene-hopene/tetraprenyl-beta-curcumene cyclase
MSNSEAQKPANKLDSGSEHQWYDVPEGHPTQAQAFIPGASEPAPRGPGETAEGSHEQAAHPDNDGSALSEFATRREVLQAAMLLVTGGASAAPRTAPRRSRPAAAAREALRRGVDYLERVQESNGSWQQYPGITALAAMAVAAAEKPSHPAVSRGARFLAGKAKPNGAIYEDRDPARALPNYNTALSMAALQVAGVAAHRPLVRRAQTYLAGSQFDESEGLTRSHVSYGGIGYGSTPDRPDLSNLQQALEALKETDYPQNADLWKKAIVFLQRCQNREVSNDQPWAGNDGGFIYASDGESKAGEHRSYASMTYAGLKSYLYCGVTRTDPRAQAAWRWIRAHYSVDENPGMRDAGLYYHYHTMSKTLQVYGQRVVTDLAGGRHAWAADLAAELVRHQAKDGSWVNRNPRWLEDNPQLVTSYALLALARCAAELQKG